MGWLGRCPALGAASGLPPVLVDRWLAVEDALELAAAEFGVPLGLVTAVAFVESNFEPTAKSSAGAAGLMQLMPGTLKFLLGPHGLDWPAFDPLVDVEKNARVGAYYLKRLLRRWKTRPVEWAIASYYAGAGAVGTYGPGQFGKYVDRVLEARKAVELTISRCAGAPWALDSVPRWPGQRSATGKAGPKPRHDDEIPGSGGPRPEHAPRSEFGEAALLGVGLLGALIAFRERRSGGGR